MLSANNNNDGTIITCILFCFNGVKVGNPASKKSPAGMELRFTILMTLLLQHAHEEWTTAQNSFVVQLLQMRCGSLMQHSFVMQLVMRSIRTILMQMRSIHITVCIYIFNTQILRRADEGWNSEQYSQHR